ncbi:hypothetical protein EMIHUDRAFT_197921 [Emiliania huxleyi CCMP1516]|uniref:RING-type domain-containing protein n=2 Tax=Emiliania huxleyi TaxID=2903 RepID=A0A0D3IDY8_EMIH1|nr:hypothetical protein EMIHUDRAFT_197921 [Emiliania huxleyi CCMP1516]EOD09473.1 hypothetical protein EMIHUDRAFT_197921 [Emiliania huxleyi CCMP1516]|eukprot:XP_005761902.1 hypothetical protein EMIHUDRAFT_197921 [Emiliania huxleyi CCMP1516]
MPVVPAPSLATRDLSGMNAVREIFRLLASSAACDSPGEHLSRAFVLRKLLERREVVAILLRSGARWPFPAELPPGTNRGWVAQWSAMQKAVSDVQRRLDEPQPAGSMTSQGLMGEQRRLDKHASPPLSGPDPLSRLDLDKPWMEHILGGSAQERAREFLRQQNLLPAQGHPVKQVLSVPGGDLLSAQQRVREVLQQQGRQVRPEGAGAESPAGRPNASNSAVAVILALLLVAHLPQASAVDHGREEEGQQTAPKPAVAEAEDAVGEAGAGHAGRSTPSAPPPEVLSLADASFDTGRRDAPESTIGGQTTCIVCFTRPKSHVAVPCGHQCVCGPCSARLRACPYCRTPAERWWHVRVV